MIGDFRERTHHVWVQVTVWFVDTTTKEAKIIDIEFRNALRNHWDTDR